MLSYRRKPRGHTAWEVGKKNVEIRNLLGLEPVSLVMKKGRLRWL